MKKLYIKSFDANQFIVGPLLEYYANYSAIPTKIWQKRPNWRLKYYLANLWSAAINLPYRFIQKAVDTVILLNCYNILALNNNAGLAGHKIWKNFSDLFPLSTGEILAQINQLANLYYLKSNICNQLIINLKQIYLVNIQNKLRVILSFWGLFLAKYLRHYLKHMYNILTNNGYLAFCLSVNKKTKLSLKCSEFIVNFDKAKNLTNSNKFVTLKIKGLSLEINNIYSLIIYIKLV